MEELRWQIESQQSYDCGIAELHSNDEDFKCTCSDPYTMSDEEVLKWHGIK